MPSRVGHDAGDPHHERSILGCFPASRSLRASLRHWIANRNTPGRTRTCNPRFRSLRRIDFATPEETTKSTVSRCRNTTSASVSGFAAVVSFTVQRLEKGTDLRNPQIQIDNPNPSDPLPSDALGRPSAGFLPDRSPCQRHKSLALGFTRFQALWNRQELEAQTLPLVPTWTRAWLSEPW
jgi:hypothetical protein